MGESKNRKNKKKSDNGMEKNARVVPANFYGALKSKNEIYFQMASLFKEVTHDEKKLENKWMEQILISNHPDSSGKYFINNL